MIGSSKEGDRSMFLRLMIVCVSLGLSACAEEESSTCEVGGPCEEYLLIQCECCGDSERVEGGGEDLVAQCQQDKRAACETGQLMINQSPETCASNLDTVMQYRAAGMDFCAEMDSEQLDLLCLQPTGAQSNSDE